MSLRNATPTGLCRIGGSYPERFGSILLKVLSMAAYVWMDTMRMFISAMVENGLGLCDDLLRITATNMIKKMIAPTMPMIMGKLEELESSF